MKKSPKTKILREIKYPIIRSGFCEIFRFALYWAILVLACMQAAQILDINAEFELFMIMLLSPFIVAIMFYYEHFLYKSMELDAGRLVLLRSQVTNPLYDPEKIGKTNSLSADLPYILTLTHDYDFSELVGKWTKPFRISYLDDELRYTSDWSFRYEPSTMGSPKRYEFLTIVDQWIKWTIQETDCAFTPGVMSFRRRLLERLDKIFDLDDDSIYPTYGEMGDGPTTDYLKQLYKKDQIKDNHLRIIAKKLLYDLSIQFQGTDSGRLVGLISEFILKKDQRWVSDEPPYNSTSMGPIDLGDEFFNEYQSQRGIFSTE